MKKNKTEKKQPKDLFNAENGNPFDENGKDTSDIPVFEVDKQVKKKKHKNVEKLVAKEKKKNSKKKKTKSENPFNGKKKRKGKKNSQSWWAVPLSAACILILGFLSLYGVNAYFTNAEFVARKASIENASFYNGIVLENYDLSGKTTDEVKAYWDKWIEKPLRETGILFEVGSSTQFISAEELGYSSDYEAKIEEAWNSGREGTFEERYRNLGRIRSNPATFEVSRTLFDEDMLRAYTDEIAERYTWSAENAQILDFDFESHAFTFSESRNGSEVDADALFMQAKNMLENGGGKLKVEIKEILPEISQDDLDGKFGMITQALTNASSSNNNRLTNLTLACAAINGTVVKPGETFSYNDVVGERTKARGYKMATVYQSGEVAQDIGGGVCQVSTTLWNAAMKADCEIVERHEHSRPVSYVDKGKDATVSWKSQDMKFKNTSDYPLYIVAYVSNDKRVYCEIYGKLFPDGQYIKIEAETTKKIQPPDPIKTYNPALSKGQQVVISEARTGYKANAYRVYYNADGTVIEKVLLCRSYYKETAAKIEYGG